MQRPVLLSVRPASSVKRNAGYCIRRTDTDSDLPPPGITRVSLNREHYYANPNPLAVSASKSRGTVSGIRGPHGDFRGRLPVITPPPDWVASFFSLMSGERTGIRPIADAVKVSSNRSLVKERGVSLATPIVYQSRAIMSTTFFKKISTATVSREYRYTGYCFGSIPQGDFPSRHCLEFRASLVRSPAWTRGLE